MPFASMPMIVLLLIVILYGNAWNSNAVSSVLDNFNKFTQQTGNCDSPHARTDKENCGAHFECVKDGGVEPPCTLSGSFHTHLLHELDVLHYEDWRAQPWFLGAGAFAEVHLGRLAATGKCVAVKRFNNASVTDVEQEIRIHKYMEQHLPNIPRLLGLLPSSRSLEDVSLVLEYLANSHTLHDWKTSGVSISRVHWLSVALQIAETMEVMHRKCVLHNDLHSGNVLVTMPTDGHLSGGSPSACGFIHLDKEDSAFEEDEDEVEDEGWLTRILETSGQLVLPQVVFIDFGHATFRQGKRYSLSSDKSFVHLAPEVLKGSVTSRAADVYSLGHQLDDIAMEMNCSRLAAVAGWCMHGEADLRPHIRDVVDNLRQLFLQAWRQASSITNWDGMDPVSASAPFSFPIVRHLQPRRKSHSASQNFCQNFGQDLCDKRVQNDKTLVETTHCAFEGNPIHRRKLKLLSERKQKTICSPYTLQDRISSSTLPYLTSTEIKVVETKRNGRLLLSESDKGVITAATLVNTGEMVVVKQLTRSSFTEIRYEALVNLYLNDTGWVPRFYGVAPCGDWDLRRLGIVQEFFAGGITLGDVLNSGKPGGFDGRVALAHRLSWMLADIHSRQILLNNLNVHNILCACEDLRCFEIKVIDLGASCSCAGKLIAGESSYLAQFVHLAPEVRRNQLTSYASDVYSLCVVLLQVLDVEILLNDTNINARSETNTFHDFIAEWSDLSTACLSYDRSLRPSAAMMKGFFDTFLSPLF